MTVVRQRRLVNPGRKRRYKARNKGKRKLSALQKLFFGSKRQRAAAKANVGRKRRRNTSKRKSPSFMQYFKSKKAVAYNKVGGGYTKRKRRKRNVGSIVTVLPLNPGRRKRSYRRKNRSKKIVIVNKGVKRMARTHKRSYRRRRNPVYRGRIKRGVYKYTSNPRRRRRHNVSRRRYARRNPGVRRHHRRRNPGLLGGGLVTKVAGVLGGVAITKLLSGFLPSMFSTGVMQYLGIGVVAVAQGKLIGKVAKSSELGNNLMVGGLAFLAAKVMSDMFPSIGSSLGVSGMGLIGGSSFYVPQVNASGNMGTFVAPAAVTNAIGMSMPAPTRGVGSLRRTGRLM